MTQAVQFGLICGIATMLLFTRLDLYQQAKTLNDIRAQVTALEVMTCK